MKLQRVTTRSDKMRKPILTVFILIVSISGIFPFIASANETDEEQNITLTRHFIQDVWNKRSPESADSIIDPNCIFYSNGVLMGEVGPGVIKKMITRNLDEFPDFSMIIEDVFAKESKVCLRYLFRGTYQKLNKPVQNEAIGIIEFDKGKIIKMWLTNDQLSVFRQLGFIMKPPADMPSSKETPKEPAKE
jgi:predicted ester cyclase